MKDPVAAVVLPPREGFGPGNAGALGLLAARYAATPGFRTVVLGGEQDGPTFPGVAFQPVKPAWWWAGNINLRFAASLFLALRRLRPAIIEVHNRPEIALALARLFPRTPVGLLLNNDPQSMRAARTAPARARLLRRLRPVMASSDYLKQRFMEGVDPAAGIVEVLHNCIDIDAIPPTVPREHLIVFAGRVVPDKAPDSFVRACGLALSDLPGWRAEMIGADGHNPNSNQTPFLVEVRALAAKFGVHMTGYLDHTRVLDAMRRAAIVIVPSRWNEPFGLTALEAIACGAALIVSKRGGLPEVAGEAAVYIDPDDPADIAAAILDLARDPTRRAALSEAGEIRARGFDTTIMAARLADLRLLAMKV